MKLLELENLTVTYDKKPVLWGVDYTLEPGRLVGILGPNGAGKSTLIKAILGLLPLSTGERRLFGKRPGREELKRVAFLPQRENVDWDFPVRVRDVVLMGRYGHLRVGQRPSRHDEERVDQALERVGMLPFADRQIGNLSGGQQQRVFLARALVQDSEVYFMDEPFAGVDALTEKAILEVLRELRDAGKSLMIVHHDLSTAKAYFDDLVLLNVRVIAAGPSAEVFKEDLLKRTYGGHLAVFSS